MPLPVARRRRRAGLPGGVSFEKAIGVLAEAGQRQGDGILWVNDQGRILVSNSALARLLGRGEQSLRGASLGELDPVYGGAGWAEQWDLVQRHGPLTYESTLTDADGTAIEVEMTQSGVLLGDQLLMSIVVRDITQRRRAEHQIIEAKRRLEEAVRLKNDFLVALSHQIRTPLNSVMGATSLLLEEVSDPELLGLVRIVMRGERQLLSSLGGIGEVTQIEMRLAEARLEPLALGPLVRQVTEDQRALAVERRLELEVVEEVADLVVTAAPTLVQEIVRRLVDNAVRFTEAGSVTVRLRRVQLPHRSQVEVVVEDTGAGMEPEFLLRVFRPLVQDPNQRPSLESRGLGLAVAQVYARVQGASLTVTSQKSVGSSFTLAFPDPRPAASA